MMKNKFYPILCLFFLLTSCSGMNDIIQDYLDRGEMNYIGRPDSLTTTGGKERMKVKWLIGKDPRAEGYIIYWNNRQDSVVGTINRNELEKGRFCSRVFDIPESSYEFEVVQTGKNSVNSIASTVTGSTYGSYYISQLKKREITKMEDLSSQHEIKLLWGLHNDCKYVEFTYKKADGSTATQKVLSNETVTILPNPKSLGEYSYTTWYVPGKDSLDVFKAPEVVNGNFPF